MSAFCRSPPKYCVVPRPPAKTFMIHRLKDCVWTQVYEGKLVEGGAELESGWVGEFTSLQEEGTYQIRCGARQSRCFVVWRRAYDVPMRVLYKLLPLATLWRQHHRMGRAMPSRRRSHCRDRRTSRPGRRLPPVVRFAEMGLVGGLRFDGFDSLRPDAIPAMG